MINKQVTINDVDVFFFGFYDDDEILIRRIIDITRENVKQGDWSSKSFSDINKCFVNDGITNVIVNCGTGVTYHRIHA